MLRLRLWVTIVGVGTVTPFAANVDARITRLWTYQEMFDKSDLVVVARVTSTTKTEERSVLNDVNPPVPVVGVITKLKCVLALKASGNVTTFQLHHYDFETEGDRLAGNHPNLVQVAGEGQTFLLFLVRDKEDGKYAPTTGQTDPAAFSVIELKAAPYE
jgi:hypothetical protein